MRVVGLCAVPAVSSLSCTAEQARKDQHSRKGCRLLGGESDEHYAYAREEQKQLKLPALTAFVELEAEGHTAAPFAPTTIVAIALLLHLPRTAEPFNPPTTMSARNADNQSASSANAHAKIWPAIEHHSSAGCQRHSSQAWWVKE